MEISEHLKGILATLPAKPGCYLMKNAEGTIIYVGKAISLKNRVRSYFHADTSHDDKTRRLVREIARYRMDRGRLGTGGVDPRDEPDQEAPAQVQHPPQG